MTDTPPTMPDLTPGLSSGEYAPKVDIVGTVVAVPDQIRKLATWLNTSLTDKTGLFVLAAGWLSDASTVGYAGGWPLHFELAQGRANGKEDFVGEDEVSIGILPGYCLDNSYWKSAYSLKNQVDAQLLEIYKRVTPGSGGMTGSLYDMIATVAATLNQVADDYDKGTDQIMADLGTLESSINNADNSFTNNKGGA